MKTHQRLQRAHRLHLHHAPGLDYDVPIVVVAGKRLAVFDLVMNKACATDLGKADWRVASQDVGTMLPVVVDGRVVEMFCVPLVQMMSTLISIATMPEWSWMEPEARQKLADRLTR